MLLLAVEETALTRRFGQEHEEYDARYRAGWRACGSGPGTPEGGTLVGPGVPSGRFHAIGATASQIATALTRPEQELILA